MSYQKIPSAAQNLILVTTTFYPTQSKSDLIRASLAKTTIKNAIAEGFEIIVVDGGSPVDLVDEFQRLGAQVVGQKVAGMGNAKRQAFKLAEQSGKEVIVWIEPEKAGLVAELLKAAWPILTHQASLVIPSRLSLESYPTAQQYSEQLGNKYWHDLVGSQLDMWFGPRLWHQSISHYFSDYDGQCGDQWEGLFIPVLEAIHDGHKVIKVPVDYTHPPEQTQVEENDLTFTQKRIDQLTSLVDAIETHWKKLKQS